MTMLTAPLRANELPSTARRSIDTWAIVIWLGAALLAAFFAMIDIDSTLIDGEFFPRGNDSLYHARRILDTALGSGFYQFDERLHVPDGTWIPWPWAYDYLLAQALRFALWVSPSLDALAFLSYVPVAWVLVNAALFLAAARAIGLSTEMQLIAMLGFALSPLTQLLHDVGMVDHHYMEYTFVLATIWLGTRWFQAPNNGRRALALGLVLGVAPAFHTGLFLLQLAPLTAVFVLWLRGSAPPLAALRSFAIGLLVATQLVLLPSAPYRAGMFEFGLLSWFHFYVAACTVAALSFMGWRPFDRRSLAMLAAFSSALAAPLGAQLLRGAGFLSGKFSILNNITEVQSPLHMFVSFFGPMETVSYYSWLLVVVPGLLAYFAYRVIRETRPDAVYYAVAATLGLTLFLQQFRFYYFGLFAMITGCLVIIDRLRARHGWHRGAVLAAALAGLALAYQPALRERLFVVYAPGASTEYAGALGVFLNLRQLCADNPGVVLANPDDGNSIRFHSDCGVLANNFILSPEDKTYIDEVYRLFDLSPAQIREQRPDVRYLFVRVRDFSIDDGEFMKVVDKPISRELLFSDDPPEGYTLLKTINRRFASGEVALYAKLFAVAPP